LLPVYALEYVNAALQMVDEQVQQTKGTTRQAFDSSLPASDRHRTSTRLSVKTICFLAVERSCRACLTYEYAFNLFACLPVCLSEAVDHVIASGRPHTHDHKRAER